jgi:DNA-binding CsgD family transcriptional regulator
MLAEEVIGLYEREADLLALPTALFSSVSRLTDADVVTYTEWHAPSGEFRSAMSAEDDPTHRNALLAAFARHRASHPFWLSDPAFFGERALRESDFFSEEEFIALPIAREVFLPGNARRIMSVVIQHQDYTLAIASHRVTGRKAFSDEQRDLLQAFRQHIARCYRQAHDRTLAYLSPVDRLCIAFPELTKRQVEVAAWVASGKSNKEISTILGVGIDTVKAHMKALHAKIGVDSRATIAIVAHTIPPFARRPPLWRIGTKTWTGKAA